MEIRFAFTYLVQLVLSYILHEQWVKLKASIQTSGDESLEKEVTR